MKPILFLLGALLAGAASAGLTVLLVSSERAPERAASPAREAATPTSDSGDVAALRGELALLSRSLGDLQAEVDSLRGYTMRQPMALEVESPVTAESLAAAGLTPVQIEERMRDVIASERRREEDEREAQQADRARAQAERQAERIAAELGLAPADRTRLAEHFVAAGVKRRELFESVRGGDFDGVRVRASMEELRAWNSRELYRNFSPSVAAQIEELGNDVFGGGRGPRGGGRRGGTDGDSGGGWPTPPGGG